MSENTDSAIACNPDYQIRILLHGLLLTAFKREGEQLKEFHVGVLHKLISRHVLSLQVIDTSQIDKPINVSIDKDCHLTLEGLSDPLKKEPDNKQDPNSLAWMLDYNALHEPPLAINRNSIAPRLTIKNGKVHSLIRSVTLSKDEPYKNNFRQITQVVAVDIKVKASEKPKLMATINGKPTTLFGNFMAGKRYNIILRYDCAHCVPASHSTLLDLKHLNDCFTLPQGKEHVMFFHRWKEDDPKSKEEIYAEIDREYAKDRYALIGLEDIYPQHGFNRLHPCGLAYSSGSAGIPS